LIDSLKPNQGVEIKLFVDDEHTESVSGAIVKIEADGNSIIDPDVIRTDSDGSAKFTVTGTKGPTTSINFVANAEGYTQAKDSITINVDGASSTSGTFGSLNLPEWIVYVIIAVIVVMAVVVLLFLKKSKVKVTEEWEDEEI